MTDITTNRRWATDHHASRASLHPAERRPDYYYPPDSDLDEFCPGCTPELREGGQWVHDRACVMARARRTA